MRTTSQSESTRVPPVTEERSPPDSRTTGADSPVIALSLTVAAPSMTSPSPGTRSPGSTSTVSPRRSSVAGVSSTVAPRRGSMSLLARISSRVPRSAAACALPRPSATLSAKFANSNVNQSQIATASTNANAPFSF
jgi:hypothetical protein